MTLDEQITPDPDLHLSKDITDPDDWQSETTSLASTICKGLLENGRRYQTLRATDSHVPSDDQMFETYELSHLLAFIIDSHLPNPLFQAPVKTPKNILDIGTGKGSWAIDVADMFPEATVRGVDLFPPPVTWLPPNCVLEVDDILQPWTWREPFDLVHLRLLDSAFTPEETDLVYKQCFEHIRPGGWIEQLEMSSFVDCDDGSMPEDSILRGWGPRFTLAADKANRPLGIMRTFRESIEKAGFVDVHIKDYKWPIGPWAKDKQLKEVGAVNFRHWQTGMEGYGMWLLTKFGDPVPWTKEEVQVYVAKMRKELSNPRIHVYQKARRIWARKPLEGEKVKKEEEEIKQEK
ncbi:hypothetical protein N7462_003281 [Penicillium macrosclerotiorum]|uniref:uncharacterized protein n=1 Tax=Penicillium macrosclerotiorum TaxID=303699 RepID=UPI0025476D96|nr:uncharacterized protein N7462_003281 [Penicillium macrosclerotiorum]KAJ5688889.1 hypothetical protein N7462_003281 [Penicillium macrosclerotiorum]